MRVPSSSAWFSEVRKTDKLVGEKATVRKKGPYISGNYVSS